jgi:hypothetical protein
MQFVEEIDVAGDVSLLQGGTLSSSDAVNPIYGVICIAYEMARKMQFGINAAKECV